MQHQGATDAEKGGNNIVSLYISYWSLQDPLCQTQSLAYLRELTKLGYKFALITFEQPKYALNREQSAAIRKDLAEQGIYWYPLRYHKRFSLMATAFDCLCGVGAGVRIVFRHKARVAHSRASIPAAMGLVLSRLCGLKFLYDADSALSDEYADVGHWKRGGAAFRVTAWFEALARQSSHSVVVLSEQLRHDFIHKHRVRAPVAVIPCCVDTNKFRFDAEARARRRRELGVGEEKLLVYVGKIGSWYSVDETFEFFKAARAKLGRARLLVLSGDPPESFHELAARHGLGSRDYHVRRARHEEVAEWLSASDVGLAFITSLSSKRGSSPVKVGEYLACGLPVVITPGIGDYSALIARERLGTVVESLTREGYLDCADRLAALWTEGEGLRARCRAAAEANVSLERVGAARYQAVYEELL